MPGLIVEAENAKGRKLTKNEKRRLNKKEAKKAVSTPDPQEADANHPLQPVEPTKDDPVQDVPDVVDFDGPLDDPLYSQFADVFAKFREESKEDPASEESGKPTVFYDDDDNIQGEEEEEETQKRLSKKARKAAGKLSIAELKAIVKRPDIVDWTDISASDPKLLVNIKCARNVVPVPTHWSLKREYLSSKRGIEKAGFALPKFIAETGISEMRDAVLEKQADASLKQRQRERVQPKMGKLDIDYTKLYEAFFRRQTKPELTGYGEVYYEGKESETKPRSQRPGNLSDELREALNMPPGAPPPWLINMQKTGPPPSYPAIKIPGLNAPPPPGASWGFHPGGFGKPPTDEEGKPLWGGDIFGNGEEKAEDAKKKDDDEAVYVEPEVADKSLWGELQPFVEEEEVEEDEDEDEEGDEKEEDDDAATTGLQTPFGGMETPGGIQSTVPTDFGTHSMAEEFNLRKARRGTETEESHHPRAAGQVLKERNIRAEGFFGGERAYDLNQARPNSNYAILGERDERGRKRKAGEVEVSLDADALERDDKLSKDELRRQYELQRSQEGVGGWKGVVDQEDLSQMIAEEGAKRQKRDAEREKRRR
ncbi:hypothetical protein BDY17DRAFT_258620 [Neohortaea acidophila]|uniref:PSP proline-rich domain-containing protein n=1 Tax=Neohortaea acidophila TaxID=245834 RepID=A0A6A6PFS2_9PEZI|nr:uncharacterized protein BDY17DRAFT_258620 [Neohortaea acidophila]KAF2478606.1 hypothetical protein BDY17DRAFT_258620 [Neohortaea acidophila]